MKRAVVILLLISILRTVHAQDSEIFFLKYAVSINDTIVYKRMIQFDKADSLYRVRDYFENGQIQMDASYSSFDKHMKEEYQCNYFTNTKEGPYRAWYRNGQIEFAGNYKHGLRNGSCTSWYKNGQKAAEENWSNGQLHGRTKYWTEKGDLQFDLLFDHGLNQDPKDVSYRYLSYVPREYDIDTVKKWPLIIYLHGGSDRGTDLKKLYSSGIPDQIYRGREFPFIIISPQCPKNIRWSTDNWFEAFYKEVTARYRIDSNRIYLTGFSLGGAGTWYLAVKYSDTFAAIAPMSGFTSIYDYIDDNINKLADMPIWAFHGKADNVVAFEETERIVKKLEIKNKDLKFSAEPEAGHEIHWLVYPRQELYDWFLKYKKRSK